MTWFRTNRGVAVWLALFALACQFAFSFGHVHIGKFGGGSPGWTAAQPENGSAGSSPRSPQKNPTGPAGDFCAICANVGLAGTLLLPVLALILAPDSFTKVLQWSLSAGMPTSLDHLSFNARGPPLA
jgi:hypothetical protein